MTENPNNSFRPETRRIETIEIEPTVDCSLTVECSPMCPIVDEIDHYKITIEWTTTEKTLEKHKLRQYIKSFSGSEVTQEALCDQIYNEIADEIDAKVIVQDIAHMDMVVEKG